MSLLRYWLYLFTLCFSFWHGFPFFLDPGKDVSGNRIWGIRLSVLGFGALCLGEGCVQHWWAQGPSSPMCSSSPPLFSLGSQKNSLPSRACILQVFHLCPWLSSWGPVDGKVYGTGSILWSENHIPGDFTGPEFLSCDLHEYFSAFFSLPLVR